MLTFTGCVGLGYSPNSRHRDLHLLRQRYEPEDRYSYLQSCVQLEQKERGWQRDWARIPKTSFGLVKEFESDLESCAFEEGENLHFRKRSLQENYGSQTGGKPSR